MTKTELKVCLAIAQSPSDLSRFDDSILYGFGCPDFQPVMVSPFAVAKCIRWQCCKFNGEFDWQQFNEDAPFYLKRLSLSSFAGMELRELQETLAAIMAAKLAA